MHYILRVSVSFPIALFYFSYLCHAMEPESYFSCDDLKQLLITYESYEPSSEPLQDRWWRINNFRKMVSSSLSKGLGDIFQDNHPNRAIVEIGCGNGYRFPLEQENAVIRLQPDKTEFYCLVKEKIPNSYPINIGKFCEIVSCHSEKSISHYLAINVFDTMNPKDREVNLEAISKTQKKGDKVSIVLDANPELTAIIQEIISEHPDMIVLPYIPAGYYADEQFYKMSVILLPKSLSANPIEMDGIKFDEQIVQERKLRHMKTISDSQKTVRMG